MTQEKIDMEPVEADMMWEQVFNLGTIERSEMTKDTDAMLAIQRGCRREGYRDV